MKRLLPILLSLLWVRVVLADYTPSGIGAAPGLGATLAQGTTSATLEIFGDSTGIGFEPQLALDLDAAYPAYTINYRAWNTASGYVPTATAGAGSVGPLGRRAWTFASAGAELDNAEIASGGSAWFTSDLDIRVRLQPVHGASDWTISTVHQCFISSLNVSGFGIIFRLDFTNQKLLVSFNNNGANVQTYSTVNPNSISAITSATDVWLQVTCQMNNGSNHNASFYYSIDGGVTWVQIGTTVTVSGITVNTNSSLPWYLGAGTNTGASLCTNFLITGVEIRNGINGAIMNPINLEAWYPSVTGSSCSLSGSPTLEIISECFSGQNMSYWVTNFAKSYIRGSPTFVLFNDGFNNSNGWEDFVSGAVPSWDTMFSDIQTADPSATVGVMLQNPVTSASTSPPFLVNQFRVAKQRSWASARGLRYIDVNAAFLTSPLWAGGTLITGDFLHPSTLGYALMATTITNAIQNGK